MATTETVAEEANVPSTHEYIEYLGDPDGPHGTAGRKRSGPQAVKRSGHAQREGRSPRSPCTGRIAILGLSPRPINRTRGGMNHAPSKCRLDRTVAPPP